MNRNVIDVYISLVTQLFLRKCLWRLLMISFFISGSTLVKIETIRMPALFWASTQRILQVLHFRNISSMENPHFDFTGVVFWFKLSGLGFSSMFFLDKSKPVESATSIFSNTTGMVLFVLWGLALQWRRSWFWRSKSLAKIWKQDWQSTVCCSCVRRWVLRLDRWLKAFSQIGHLWGDSSRWRTLWTANVLLWQKPFPHTVHLNGFSLLWIYL